MAGESLNCYRGQSRAATQRSLVVPRVSSSKNCVRDGARQSRAGNIDSSGISGTRTATAYAFVITVSAFTFVSMAAPERSTQIVSRSALPRSVK